MTLIACVQIPGFPIVLARRDEPALDARPLVLYTTHAGRARVYADELGLLPGTLLRQALVRCPHANCHPADLPRDQRVFDALVALLQTFSPCVAPGSLPAATVELDLGRFDLPGALALAQRIAASIRASLRLTPALGLASSRFVAHIAAMTAGAGAAVLVPHGREAAFLAPRPISLLPLEQADLQRLMTLGLRTIGDLTALPPDALQTQFGGRGRMVYWLSRGVDDRPIRASVSAPEVKLLRRFDGAVGDRQVLERVLVALAGKLAAQLEAGGWAARSLRLTLVREQGEPWVAERVFVEPSTDRATLGHALVALIAGAWFDGGVEAIAVQVPDRVPTTARQLELFDPAAGQSQRLRELLGRLAGRYSRSFMRATLSDPSALLPEQRVRFEPLEPA